MEKSREDLKFRAVWELDCRVTPQRRRKIGAQRDQHTIIVVEKPLSDQDKRRHECVRAFWVYLDGFEASYYARESASEVAGLRHFPAPPAYAPEQEGFLLALTAAHQLYPMQVERSFPVPFQISERDQGEHVQEAAFWLRVPPASTGWVLHPYVLRQRLFLVELGEKSCEIVCSVYSSDACWLAGQCWQRRIENWCFLPAGEEPIAVYSQPPRERRQE